MKKMVMINQRATNVISFIIVLFFIASCSSNIDEDKKLVNTFLSDYKSSIKKDSIYLAFDNSNQIIIDVCQKYINSKNKSIKDSTSSMFFNENELEFYKKQLVDKTKWSEDIIGVGNVVLSEDPKKVIYITKPIYTRSRKYALITQINKSKDGEVYFIKRIKVYRKENNKWKRIHSAPQKFF